MNAPAPPQRRPRRRPLTAKVRRGLGPVRSIVSVNLTNGDAGDFQGLTTKEVSDVAAALAWLESIPSEDVP